MPQPLKPADPKLKQKTIYLELTAEDYAPLWREWRQRREDEGAGVSLSQILREIIRDWAEEGER